jgi:protocatechuate 3,4-dioxygenase beta subunit
VRLGFKEGNQVRKVIPLLSILVVFIAALSSCSQTAPSGQNTGITASEQNSNEGSCQPTPPDALGPFYEPDAPLRSSVGEGYRLSGRVKSAEDCTGISGAQLEFWLAGPDGKYSDDYRATVVADDEGDYTLESHSPPAYAGRPPHIHIRVSAEGYQTLVTQHYPQQGNTESVFDLVLLPEN